jgi:hypothetical protein
VSAAWKRAGAVLLAVLIAAAVFSAAKPAVKWLFSRSRPAARWSAAADR